VGQVLTLACMVSWVCTL